MDIISKVSCVWDVIFMLTLCLMLQGGVFVGLMTLVLIVVDVEVRIIDKEPGGWILDCNPERNI